MQQLNIMSCLFQAKHCLIWLLLYSICDAESEMCHVVNQFAIPQFSVKGLPLTTIVKWRWIILAYTYFWPTYIMQFHKYLYCPWNIVIFCHWNMINVYLQFMNILTSIYGRLKNTLMKFLVRLVCRIKIYL